MTKRKVLPPAHVKEKTVSNFQIYKAEINRLLEKTQTGGTWNISFTDKEEIDGDARCTWQVPSSWVRFAFDNVKMKNRSKSYIKSVARHEFGHFVIARMESLALRRFATEAEIDLESEAIARIFERM